MKRSRPRRNFFEQNRKHLTGFIIMLGVLFTLFTQHSWKADGVIDIAMDWLGYVMVMAGVLGRLWCTLYIGGRKNDELVREGPYSMSRNPLYFFSFVAGLGIALAVENLVLIALFILAFAVYYPSVIRAEEKRLAALFGAEFEAFRARTPAFFPKPSLLVTGELTNFQPRILFKALLDASVFLLFLPLADVIEKLHESGVLPTFWSIP